MANGRSFKPSPHDAGKWFCHEDSKRLGDMNPTTTGQMLETPFHPDVAFKCPPYFHAKESLNFRSSNTFSQKDNRRVFDKDSEYFSHTFNNRTLGRRIYGPDKNLHYTKATFLHHPMDTPRMFTTYEETFEKKTNTNPALFRRFPKVYSDAKHGPLELRMCPSNWFKDPEVYKTSSETLVDSLSPYVKHNPWKFSYQPLYKVYPN